MSIQDGKKNAMDRREFCKSIPCGALGFLSSSCLFGLAAREHTTKSSSKKPHWNTEETMTKKITAVTAKVISQKGHCGLGHKVGDTVKFTESGVEGKMCIHALYSILPKVFAMMFDAQFPWLEDKDVSTHACPDAYNPVIFEVKRIWED